jgi:5'-nucleotidase
MKRILVSNDDGIYAPGLAALVAVLEPLAEVTVVAPLAEQSASSHALTLHHPLRIREMGPRRFAVEGTPTDCVLLASNILLDGEPDLVVSGINQGPNMGEDVLYSGTVAAAMEGAILGIPSVAVSLVSRSPRDFPAAAAATRRLVSRLLEETLPSRFLVNVNIPARGLEAIRGFRATRLGRGSPTPRGATSGRSRKVTSP